ncbi:MAG: hypothetical protein P1V51_05205 [Deltaproteobacteria bacterium]|nr:hypothetical protein [Deltaproteobacteria bacterium]
MRTALSSLVALSLLLPGALFASPAAVKAAEVALGTGRAEEAFFALEDAPPEGAAEKKQYADLLLRGAELLLEVEDAVFALQLGKKALGHDPGRADARLICLQAALEANSLDEAGVHLAALEEARPDDPKIVLWRARLAAADAEWETVKAAATRVEGLEGATAEQKGEARTLARRAEVATEGEQKKLAALAQEERALQGKQEAASKAIARDRKKAGAKPGRTPPEVPPGFEELLGRRGGDEPKVERSALDAGKVFLYCDESYYCGRVRRHLKQKGVDFVEKRVDRGGFAVDELEKLGYSVASVPVFEVDGRATQSWKEAVRWAK